MGKETEVLMEREASINVGEEIRHTFATKNPYSMLKSSTFVDFVRVYEERIADAIYKVIRAIPSTMNSADYRTLLSDMYSRTLDRKFYQLKDQKSVGFDMIYNHGTRLSLKTIQMDWFQRPRISRKGITVPKPIMLKNVLSDGTRQVLKEDYFDYMLFVSAYYDKNTEEYVVKFGTVSYETVEKMKPYYVNGQMRVKIPNSKWSFISKTYRIHNPKSVEVEERKNNVLNTGLDNIYFELQRVS